MTHKKLIVKKKITIIFALYKKYQKILGPDIIEKTKKTFKKNLLKNNKIFLKKKKKTKQQYGSERYKNISENEKQKLVDYRKRYYEKLENKN